MKPDTAHWRQCSDEDCPICRSRREEYEERALEYRVARLDQPNEGGRQEAERLNVELDAFRGETEGTE